MKAAKLLALPICGLATACALNGSYPSTAVAPVCRAPVLEDVAGVATEPVSAHWVIAAGPEEGPALDGWCAAVGAPVLASGAGIDASADSILVVTWNVYVGGADVHGFVRDLREGRFTDGQPVSHFALLVQEAHRAGDVPDVPQPVVSFAHRVAPSPRTGKRTDIVEASRDLGLYVLYVPSMRNGRPGRDPAEDRGNAILSTLPLEEPTFIELPLERQRRVVALATVRASASDGRHWSLRLANVHLDNRSRPERLPAWFGAARLRQARALTAALEHEHAVVVGGDFNSWSLAQLERTPGHLRAHFPDLPDDDTRTLTMLGMLGRRLDHLVARLPAWKEGGEQVTLEERYGSDHHPVMAWIRVADAGAGDMAAGTSMLP